MPVRCSWKPRRIGSEDCAWTQPGRRPAAAARRRPRGPSAPRAGRARRSVRSSSTPPLPRRAGVPRRPSGRSMWGGRRKVHGIFGGAAAVLRRRWRWRGARGRRRCRRPSARSSAGGRGAAPGRRGGGRGRRRARWPPRISANWAFQIAGDRRRGRRGSRTRPSGRAGRGGSSRGSRGSLRAAMAYWPSVSSATR